MKIRIWLISLLVFGMWGCGHSEKELADNPKLLWEVATEAYEDGDWLEAKKYYEKFTQYFPQNEKVAIAKLRMADSLFEQSKYFEAEVHYETFVELYPQHDEVAYAWYRLGLAQKEQVPGIVARDLSKARDAKKSFSHYLVLQKTDENTRALVQDHIRDLDMQLMQKEFEIGGWYFKLGHYRSAFHRFARLLNEFDHLRKDRGDTLYVAAVRMVDSAIELKERALLEQAQKLFERFQDAKGYKDVLETIQEQDLRSWQ